MTTLVPPSSGDRLGRCIGLLNHKGGVGKTTLAEELSAAYARKGFKVLMVDMDPSANLTRRLRAVPGPGGTMADVLDRPTKGCAREAIVPCGWATPEATNIHVLPANIELETRGEEAALPNSHNRLARALYGVVQDYDYVIFDCHPSMGHLEQMVVACLTEEDDGVLIPVEPAADAIDGAYRVIELVVEWADQMEVPGHVIGVAVNHYDDRLNMHQARVQKLAQSLEGAGDRPAPRILTPYVPKRVRIAEVHDLAKSSSTDPRMDREGLLTVFDKLAMEVAA